MVNSQSKRLECFTRITEAIDKQREVLYSASEVIPWAATKTAPVKAVTTLHVEGSFDELRREILEILRETFPLQ